MERERESDWESPIQGAVAVRHGSSLGRNGERESDWGSVPRTCSLIGRG